MSHLEGRIQSLFTTIKETITGDTDCECDETFYDESQIPETIFYRLGECAELYEKSKVSTIPEIHKKSIEWLALEFKPKLQNIIIDDFKKLTQEFGEKHEELVDYIIKQRDNEDKNFEDWIKSKGLTEVKCIKCGDGHWHFASISPKDCICHTCLEDQYKEDKK